jgi:hypothetical protein
MYSIPRQGRLVLRVVLTAVLGTTACQTPSGSGGITLGADAGPTTRVWECDRDAASPGGPVPTTVPGRTWYLTSWCRGVAMLRAQHPHHVTAGAMLAASVWLTNESREAMPVGWTMELRQEVTDQADRVRSRREYPIAQVPPGGVDRRRLELALPEELEPGEYHVFLSTSRPYRLGREVEPLRLVGQVGVGPATVRVPVGDQSPGTVRAVPGLWVARQPDGTFDVFLDQDPHNDQPTRWDQARGLFMTPSNGAVYGLDGVCRQGPCGTGLFRVEARRDGDELVVRPGMIEWGGLQIDPSRTPAPAVPQAPAEVPWPKVTSSPGTAP